MGGETIVIGGLKQEAETTAVSKTPIHRDLPLLGSLCRHTRKTNRQGGLMIRLTPKILREGTDGREASVSSGEAQTSEAGRAQAPEQR